MLETVPLTVCAKIIKSMLTSIKLRFYVRVRVTPIDARNVFIYFSSSWKFKLDRELPDHSTELITTCCCYRRGYHFNWLKHMNIKPPIFASEWDTAIWTDKLKRVLKDLQFTRQFDTIFLLGKSFTKVHNRTMWDAESCWRKKNSIWHFI